VRPYLFCLFGEGALCDRIAFVWRWRFELPSWRVRTCLVRLLHNRSLTSFVCDVFCYVVFRICHKFSEDVVVERHRTVEERLVFSVA